MASVMSVRNETHSTVSRMTKDGRKISYQLNVIQQPERARACGSGAKSSADRRPVDPPPIVELRVFEGEAMNDVTFSYNANFFLFATLEPARPIAQGRVPHNPSAIPVLTGMFVSSMAYLDRPVPAGYFLFPDLSVRHEGKYRLSFNLYEELKDADAESENSHAGRVKNRPNMAGPHGPSTFVDWRLEVKSKPFTVFSAKKFPGLAESTSLSRVVAEQGCRVRIRRDVRMRRRENKAGPDFDEFEEEADYSRARASPSPEPYAQQNAASAGRHQNAEANIRPQSNVPAVQSQRRGSIHEQAPYGQQSGPQAYQQPPPAAQAPHETYSHMNYGPPSHGHYQPPQQYGPGPQSLAQPPLAYSQHQMGYGPAMHSQSYQQNTSLPPQHGRHESMEHQPSSRRDSISFHQPHPTVSSAPAYQYSDKGYPRTQPSFPHASGSAGVESAVKTPTPTANGHPLPPLKVPMPLEPRFDGSANAAGAPSASHVAPLPSPAIEVGSYEAQPQGPTSQAVVPDSMRSTKRPYGSVFDASQYDRSLRHGMRPDEAHHGAEPIKAQLDDDDEEEDMLQMARMRMHYKRADGTEISRRLPTTV